MAIEVNTALDRAQRKVSTANLANFTGVDCQLLVVKEDKRPVIMDGVTLGGKFKCASTAELEAGLATKLGKMDKAASAKVADSVSGENVTGAVANATNATNAVNAANATNVQWTGVQSVPGNVKNAVAYTAQTLTDEQKAQARDNIGVSNNLPLGHHYAWPFSTVPANSIQCSGSTYSRTLYADFWQWLVDNSLVKTESEWQSIASANGGYCPWYSSGDGTTNFRTPKFAPFMQIAIASGNVGKYHEAGAPDVTGYFTANTGGQGKSEFLAGGAFYTYDNSTGTYPAPSVEGTTGTDRGVQFRASNSNSKYGKSNTIQPESNEWMICVVVMGVATNVGSVDVGNVMSAVANVQADVGTKLPDSTVHIVETWRSGDDWYREYSDGWIEQGGRIKTQTTGNISFYKAYTGTPTVLMGHVSERTNWANMPFEIYPNDVYETYFTVKTTLTDGKYTKWYACGY